MTEPRVILFGPFRLDGRLRRLFEGDRMVHLKPKEWDLLSFLVEQRGRLVSKEELVEALWPRQFVSDANLTQTIYRVRRALGDSAQEGQWIETTPRVGYRFVGEVREAAAGDYHTWPHTLAILPFQEQDNEEAPGAWSLGLADALIRELGKDPTLIVRPLGAVIQQRQERGVAAGKILDVEAVIDGVIVRDGDRIHIEASLLATADGRCHWTRSWVVNDADRYDQQLRVAADVRKQIERQTARSEDRTGAPADRSSEISAAVSGHLPQEAHALYLQGRYCWHQFTGPALQRSITLFDEALELAPRFAEAHAWRSAALSALGNVGMLEPRVSAERARRAADRAIAIDDTLAAGFEMRGVIELYFDWNFEAAMRSFDKSIERDQQSSNAHHLRGNALAFTGHFDLALRDIERALRLDPTSLITLTDAGYVHYLAGRPETAMARLEAALAQNPHFVHARQKLIWVLVAMGDTTAALEQLERVSMFLGTDRLGERAYLLGYTGQAEQAGTLIAALEADANVGDVDPIEVAVGWLGLGQHEQSLSWLDRAEAYRSRQLTHLAVDPLWRPLRESSAFRALVKRIGFSERQTKGAA